MEPNVSAMAKKIWHMVRVVYFMLKKEISKGKLMLDLKLKLLMIKRNKLNGKAIFNLMFHHHHPNNNNWSSVFSDITSTVSHRRSHCKKQESSTFNSTPPPDPYTLSLKKRKNTCNQEDDHQFAVQEVIEGLEMLNSGSPPPPALLEFEKWPVAVRQLRVSDSPFSLRDVDEDSHIDEAAQEFIEKFYKDLRRENAMAY